MVKQTNVYKFMISINATSINRYCMNYIMLAHPITSILEHWDSALPSVIMPSLPIRQSPKLQHETCIGGVCSVQQSTVISL